MNMDDLYKHNAEWKKPDTKEYRLRDFIYVNFKYRQN